MSTWYLLVFIGTMTGEMHIIEWWPTQKECEAAVVRMSGFPNTRNSHYEGYACLPTSRLKPGSEG